MYKTVLITLDTSPTDRAIIEHMLKLAKFVGCGVVLLHVATGVPAQFKGENAGGKEIEEDEAYLRKVKEEFEAAGIAATTQLAFGEPVKEIVKWVEQNKCDLVAMSTHGHKFIADLVLGATANKVQHQISVPMLLLRAK